MILVSGSHRKELSAGFRKTTNNRMELLSVIVALEALKREDEDVVVYSDSKYVVDAVEKHVKTSPQLSLGVGTFNLRQQIAIQDEIENRRRLNPELDAFCGQDRDEPFFVKNLENIQGDERDVIFISVTYGKAPMGVSDITLDPSMVKMAGDA